MASKDVAINVALNGGSKIDQIINKAAQLEGIINGINKTPLDLNVQKATSEFDKFDTNLKAIKAGISTQQKALDQAAGAIDKYTEKIVSTQRQLSNLSPNTKKYNEVLARQEDAIKSLAKAKGDLSSIEKKLAADEERLPGVQKAAGRAKAAKIATEAISALADEYLRLGAAQEKGTKGQILKNQSQSTIARLSAQAEALKLVADNSEIASSQFNRFAIASQVASQKVYEGRQKKLNALAFGLSQSAPSVNIGTGGQSSIAAARQTIDSVIGSFGGVVKSEAALSSYIERLRSLQSLVPYLSEEYGRLERAIGDVSAEMESLQRMTQLRGAVSKIQPQAGPASLLPSQSVKSAGEQAKYLQKRNDYQERLLGVEERISQANLNTLQKTELRTRLDKALGLLAENRLDDAKRETIELEKQRMSLERMNRAQKPLTVGALGTGFSPIGGQMPGGEVIAGSPAAEGKKLRTKLSWQTALAQMSEVANQIEETAKSKGAKVKMDWNLAFEQAKEIVSDATLAGLQDGTKAAVSLGQQQLKEVERTTTKLWRNFGGPALPPGFTEAGRVQQRGGTYRTGEFSPIGGNRRFENIKASGAIVEQGLINLQNKGVDVTEQLKNLQKALNAAKEKGFDISIKTLDALNDQVVSAGRFTQLQNKVLAGQSKSGKTKAAGSGLQAALEQLKEARGASKAFLGDLNPAEAIDKIVREFNTGKPEISNTAKNLVTTYASEITAGIPAVADAMKNLGIAGIRAIKKALRMASPSRVMLEIAKNQIDTYVDFLRAALPAVEAAAKAVGEAGIPEATGIPKEAIRAPLTEKARTRPLTAGSIDRNKATAIFASSQIAGPFGQLEQVQAKIEDFINKTRTSVDLDKLFAGFSEDARFHMAKMGKSAGPDFDKLRVALADFYQIPAELTPDLDRGVNAAKQASVSGDQLEQYVLELVDGLEKINSLFKATAKLPAPFATAKIPATATASIAIPDPWETVADTISNSAIDAAIKGGRQIKQAVNDVTSSVRKNIIEDPWADALGTGSGGAIPPNSPPRGRAGGGGGVPPVPPINDVAQLLGLDAIGNISRVSTRELEALSAAASGLRAVLDPTTEGFDRLDNQLRETIGSISRQLERRDPNADFLTRRVGPRGGRAISEGLIGGAFPLLFGQGAGASLGGLLGGAAGGFAGGGLGFGLSLIGTALGTAFDQLGVAATEAGKALRDPISGFEKLKEANLLASKSQEYYIQKLIETGKISQATAIIQSEIIKKIGVSGVNDLNKLAKSSDELSKAWAEFNLQLQAALAGPMAGLLQWVTGIVKAFNQAGNFKSDVENIRSGLTPEQRAKFDKEKLDASVKPYQELEQQMAAEQKIIEKYRAMAVIKAPSLTIDPAKAEEARKAAQQAADEIKQTYRQGFQLQQQAIDLQRQAADLQRRVSDDIFNKQQEIQRTAIENESKRKQIVIETIDLEYKKRISNEEGRAAEVLAAEAELVKVKKQGEADIQAKRQTLELDIAKQKRETENYIYRLNIDIDGIRRATLNYEMSAADYRLEVERKIGEQRRIDQMGQQTAPNGQPYYGPGGAPAGRSSGRNYANVGGFMNGRQMLHGIPGYAGNDPSHSGGNAHYHFAGKNPQETKAVADYLRANNIKISEFGQYGQRVGRHAAGSQHYREQGFNAFDVAGAQVPVGQEIALMKRVHKLVNDYLAGQGSSIPQYAQAASQVKRPQVPMVNAGATGGVMANLNKQDAAIKAKSVNLEEKLNQLNEQKALQSLMDAATGERDLKQRQDAINLLKNEIQYITAASQEEQERAALGAAALTKLEDRLAVDRQILENADLMNKLTTKEKADLEAALVRGLEITKQQNELDRQALDLTQKKRFETEKAALIMQGQSRNIGIRAGYIGEAAAVFEAEMRASGNLQQARELADITQKNQVAKGNQLLESYNEAATALQKLATWENVAVTGAKSIGDAFGQTFREISAGSATAQEMLAGFFQNLANAFADMASQMITNLVQIFLYKQLAGVFGASMGGAGAAVGGAAAGGFGGGGVGAFNFFEGGLLWSANGNMFPDGIQPFAKGGIVNSPTLFKFASGGAFSTGVMGEAGPEAVLPLTRGPGGRLGVDASGATAGGGVVNNVTVNVDASGSKVQGDDQQAGQLGRLVSAAVQQELVKQQRPGGILAK